MAIPVHDERVPPTPSPCLVVDQAQRSVIAREARAAVAGSVEYVLATADYARTDRLWPAEANVFLTNPLSLAHGACGPALLLHVAGGGAPPEVERWIRRQPLSADEYPPGLSTGLAGIACALAEIGLTAAAQEAMSEALRSPLLHAHPDLMLGVAGWGLACVRLHAVTGDDDYLAAALRAADHLADTAHREQAGCYWKGPADERVAYGFGYGASGVALFLLHLHLACGEPGLEELAVAALDHDIAHRVETDLGWGWGRYEGDRLVRPYWIQGAAGIGSVAIRCHDRFGLDRHLWAARRIAEALSIKFTVTPGLFEGLAGIAEFMLDMYGSTQDDQYLDRAFDMAETILWFQLARSRGVAWPGRWLDRISNDYASGAAGIGLLLDRLNSRGGRFLLDPASGSG